MKYLRSAAVGLLLAVTVPAASVAAEDAKVVAKVNGAILTEEDLKYAEDEIGEQLSRLPAEQRRRVLIEFLIENQLVATAAEAGDVTSSSDYKSRIAYWQRRSLRDAYFETKVEGSISDDAARKAYDEEVKGEIGEEEVEAAHILVSTEEKAKEIFELLAHDGDFAELAKEHSLDPGSKANGGSLGFFGPGRMVPEFEKAAFALKKDEVSQPVKSQFGWHVIKLTDRRKQEPPAFETIKDRIKVVLLRRKVKDLIDGFRSKAEVEYVDPVVKKMIDDENAAKK